MSEKKGIIRLSDAGEKFPRCRLCGDFYVKSLDVVRAVYIYTCHRDGYSIRCDDPMLVIIPGRGDAMERAEASLRKSDPELFDCPMCRTNMKFVCTSTGYMQFKCQKARGCGLKVEHKEPDRAKPTDVGASVKDLVLDMTPEDKEKFS